jgi:hypothetical protein
MKQPHMITHTLWPRAVDRTEIVCEWHFQPGAMAEPVSTEFNFKNFPTFVPSIGFTLNKIEKTLISLGFFVRTRLVACYLGVAETCKFA